MQRDSYQKDTEELQMPLKKVKIHGTMIPYSNVFVFMLVVITFFKCLKRKIR